MKIFGSSYASFKVEECWVQLIMMCVTSVEYAVVVNGKPCGRIILGRGLRQGDPISPYLFLLCAESLSCMINKANGMMALARVPTSRRGPRISHLFFANDSLLFVGPLSNNEEDYRISCCFMKRRRGRN
jgi:hypothetical protein